MTDSIVRRTIGKLRVGDVVVTAGGHRLRIVELTPRVIGGTAATVLHLEAADGEMRTKLLANDDIASVVVEARKPLKVKVTLTVEVDRDAWALAYGETDAATIRQGVKAMFHTEGIFAADSGAEVVDAK